MIFEFLFFIVSLAIFFVLLLMTLKLWFQGTKSLYLKLYLSLGLVIAFWTLLNGIGSIVTNQHINDYLYLIRMILVVDLSYILLGFYVCFTNNKLFDSKRNKIIFTVLNFIHVTFLLTNPIHHLLYTDFNGLRPVGGKLFLIHAILSYGLILAALTIFYVNVIKSKYDRKALIYLNAVIIIPIILNVLFTFEIIKIDITPIGFFILFATFYYHSTKFKLFNVGHVAIANIFDQTKFAIIVADQNGKLIDYNEAFSNTFDYRITNNESELKDFAIYLNNISLIKNPSNLFMILSNLESGEMNGDFGFVDNKNTMKEYQVTKRDVYDNNKFVGSLVTFNDITKFSNMIAHIDAKNQKLEEIMRELELTASAKNAFIANISQEIRNPLHAIVGMTEMLNKKIADPLIKEDLTKISYASKHLSKVLIDILNVSKDNNQTISIVPDYFNYLDMINNLKNIYYLKSQQKNQSLIINIDRNIPKKIYTDELKLSQVISNLLSNAILYSPEDSSISLNSKLLSLSDKQVKIEVSVEDNGKGLTKDEKEELMKKIKDFANDSLGSNISQFGLPVSNKIIEMMDGSLSITSISGKGSKFTFHFTSLLSPSKDETIVNKLINYDFSKYTALVVDDMEINIAIIKDMLAETKIKIISANSGEEAINVYTNNMDKIDVILMDIRMPGIDGNQATKAIRQIDNINAVTVPIIAITVNAFMEDVKTCLANGMNDHVAKPVDAFELTDKIDKLLSKRRKRL